MGFLCGYTEIDLGDLIAEAQESGRDDERAINEILRRFEGLARKLGRQVASGKSYRPDVENAARFGLSQAVYRHGGHTLTFPAYARRYMAGAARREASQWRPPEGVLVVELDGHIRTMDLVEELADHAGWGGGDTADAIAALRPNQRDLLTSRYRDGADLAEIATVAGTSVSAVSQRLATIHRQLRSVVAA
jgi:DNA-directed RNA polymerase specialized sigma subunit